MTLDKKQKSCITCLHNDIETTKTFNVYCQYHAQMNSSLANRSLLALQDARFSARGKIEDESGEGLLEA